MTDRPASGTDASPVGEATGTTAAGLARDLRTRSLSAVAMAVVALLATWWQPLAFASLVAIGTALMSWEWCRVVRRHSHDWSLAIQVLAVVAAIVCTVLGYMGPALMVIFIGAIVAGLLAYDVATRMSMLGVLYVGLPAVALVWLRTDEPHGLVAMSYLLAVVAATDIGAYLAGRTIGGRRLWPAVSPGKTWSGLIGGVLLAGLVGVSFALIVPNASPVWFAVAALLLAVVSQIGDLTESAFKRYFGVKDASGLIPGHGGVMDRVDGLVFAALAAAMFGAAMDVTRPASALLALPG